MVISIYDKIKRKEKNSSYLTNFIFTGVGLDTVLTTGDAFFASSINSCRVSSDASDSILKEMLIQVFMFSFDTDDLSSYSKALTILDVNQIYFV